ncbi:UDP:flavonoid glycosyltransferase YjiC, YdhE family [Actinacidiphila guanduensis]|uniref:UDP:flavonoid glycosyltransferase YjiC, YdhE family n=2 Tax=Actinacidiphila guanduensis TaxID=310781 RepID=A0A1H0S1X3_9ACTN|nr:UDP:flavonoid glycosyltransferase YjiC, YdhE family [Actinacidiphila guanduensis]
MTAGSHGDVAPFTGLGNGLARAGHDVVLVTHARFAPLAAEAGLDFHPLPVDPRETLASEAGQSLHRSTTGIGKLARLIRMTRSLVGDMTEELIKAAEGCDFVLAASPVAPLCHSIAEAMGLPSIGTYLQPLAATGEFAPPVTGTRSLGPWGNRAAGLAVASAVEALFADAIRTVQARFGLPRTGTQARRRLRERRDWPILHGFSPLVVPRPRDWRPSLTIAGYWWPHEDPGPMVPALADFLAAGAPPVLVTLGSATVPDPDAVSALITGALRDAGLRGVVQRGWSGLHAAGDDMLTVDSVPHHFVFPHIAAVVHHAGAGTTAAGLRAGIPAVPIPVQFDEGFWGARLKALGVAPAVLPLRRLSRSALTATLVRATTRSAYRDRARHLAPRINAEDGIAPVLHAISRIADETA